MPTQNQAVVEARTTKDAAFLVRLREDHAQSSSNNQSTFFSANATRLPSGQNEQDPLGRGQPQ